MQSNESFVYTHSGLPAIGDTITDIQYGSDVVGLEFESGKTLSVLMTIQYATVISAFPGTGKSYFYDNFKDKVEIHDSDSSTFDKDNFPDNYLEHIKALMNTDKKTILVSSHEEVRNALVENGIKFYLIYPDKSLKDEYMARYKERGSDDSFISMMDDKFDDFVDSCEALDSDLVKHIKITETGTFITDLLG